jgi:TRAP-type uncharacterized transport system substrate-binding protein
MSRSSCWSVIWGIAALIALGIVTWLALEYFVPSPPARITIGAGGKGTSFEYFAEHYRKRFERAGVNLIVRETAGALENLKLLKDPNSGVQIGFLTGGISNSEDARNLSSMGLISNVPFWIFYPSSESLTGLSQLKGKRIAVGPGGSGARYTAERLLSKADINAKTATLLPFSGNAAVEALMNGSADVALIVGGSDAPSVAKLLTNPKLRLMNFSSTAEALTRMFPDLVRLVLPKGVVEIDPPNPPEDITLVGTTAKVLIRDDLHPAIVQLMAQIMKEEHQGSGLFQRRGEFPAIEDPEFPVSRIAADYYKNGPSFLARYLPSWMTVYAQRAIAFIVAALAIVFPAFGFAPRLYEWLIRQRLRKLYRRLRVVEIALQRGPTAAQIKILGSELAEIDHAATAVPLRQSDLYFTLRYHLDQTRSRLAKAASTA